MPGLIIEKGEFLNTLRDYLMDAADDGSFGDGVGIDVVSFKEAGLLTNDDGVQVTVYSADNNIKQVFLLTLQER